MKAHTKLYMDAFGYSTADYIPSEISGERANDIHHIKCRGMGGDPTKSKDRIENLQALTREEHLKYGDNPAYMNFLYKKHLEFLEFNGVKFDRNYLLSKIDSYSDEAVNEY